MNYIPVIVFKFVVSLTRFLFAVHGPAVTKRLENVKVTAAILEEDIFSMVCGEYDGTLNQFYTIINCQAPMRAQFVQMLIDGKGMINIYEFEVHGFTVM